MSAKLTGVTNKCHICLKEVSKANGIPRHMLSVHLTCTKCNQSFPTRKEAKEHQIKKHQSMYSNLFQTDRLNVQCNQCQFQFARKDGLRPHMLAVHFECQKCDTVFENKLQILQHVKEKHPKMSTIFLEAASACKKCSKKFRDNSTLNVHRRSDHLNCDICEKNFESEESILQHLKHHEKSFKT